MFTLPNLPYAHNALEPHVDALTMEIHHGKHHQAYVNNLNAAIEGSPMAGKSLEELMKEHSDVPAVRNNGGGHFNHSLFWTVMSPNGGGLPTGDLGADINATTSYDDTVYELTVPNDDDIVRTGLDVLEEWLSFATIDPDDVEAERGIVLDEWRSRSQSANGRVSDALAAFHLAGSAYEGRSPIGGRVTRWPLQRGEDPQRHHAGCEGPQQVFAQDRDDSGDGEREHLDQYDFDT